MNTDYTRIEIAIHHFLSPIPQTQGAVEKVQEQREEIQRMIDAILVMQGSPSFIHQLKSLMEQTEAFLRRINVSSILHTVYSILHCTCMPSYSILHVIILHTPCYHTRCTHISIPPYSSVLACHHTPYSILHVIILDVLTSPFLHTPVDGRNSAAESSVASPTGEPLP